MTTICQFASKTGTPCTRIAVVAHEDSPGLLLCEEHKAIMDLGRVADSYHVIVELLDEAIEEAKETVIVEEPGLAILERARKEAESEIRAIKGEMDAIDPL